MITYNEMFEIKQTIQVANLNTDYQQSANAKSTNIGVMRINEVLPIQEQAKVWKVKESENR